jgi:predicted Zn-dependent protease
MKYIPKEIPEGINVSSRHPLLNFAYLVGTVVLASILIFVVLGFIASFLATRVSPETESKMADMLVLPLDKEMRDEKRAQYLENLLSRLMFLRSKNINLENSLSISGETTRLPLKVHLINSEVINAAITIGGHVLIHTALLETIESENELALVLAHELGHFQARDPLKSLGRPLVFMVVSTAIGLSLFKSNGLPDIISLTFELTNLSYSRAQERAADLYGFYRVVNHYGHGGYSLDFFKRLNEGNSLISKYFVSHPLSQERIDYLKNEAVKKGWKMEGEKTPLPQWLHCPKMAPCE